MHKQELIQKINEANTAYAAGIPFMTDYEYDQLWQQLHNIDPTNPILYHTAQQAYIGGNLVVHKYPIYGTNKAFNMLDMKPFLTRFGDQQLVIEPKYDGCAAVITQTKSGTTLTLEGDGKCGRDVTHLIPYVTYSFDFPLRHFQAVEIIIPLKDWNPSYGKNPRNVVSGWLARKHEAPPIKMTAVPHNFGAIKEKYQYSGNIEEFSELLLKLYSEWSKTYPIDGLMIKVADEQSRLIAGNNGQTNNWSIAWKPPIQIKKSPVTGIELNVSRLGRVIPTVIYAPVDLCETTNSRATGNNMKWLIEKKIQIGSIITIGKAGEIIPKIIEVDNSTMDQNIGGVQGTNVKATAPERPAVNAAVVGPHGNTPPKQRPVTGLSEPPVNCPKCGEKLAWEGVHLICNGSKCITQLINSVTYFYSNNGIMIDGVGPGMAERLLHNEKLYKILSNKVWVLIDPLTYNISSELLSVLGDKVFANIIEQIKQANNTKTMANFISGLGLPGIAYKTTLRLCQYVKSGKINIPVSKKAIKSFFEGIMIFNDAKKEMKNFKFAPLPEKAKAIYCITGTLSQSRDAMLEYFAGYGYEFSTNVVRETNYLIVGSDPGKIKRRYANKYNIPQVTEEQFVKLLNKEK